MKQCWMKIIILIYFLSSNICKNVVMTPWTKFHGGQFGNRQVSMSPSPRRMKLCKHISILVTWNGNGRWVYACAFETRVGKHLFHSTLKPLQTLLAGSGVTGVCDIWFRDSCYWVAEECQCWQAEIPLCLGPREAKLLQSVSSSNEAAGMWPAQGEHGFSQWLRAWGPPCSRLKK